MSTNVAVPRTMSVVDSLLLVIDEQEKLAPAIADGARVIAQTACLLQAAQQLALPRWVSEQYVRGLGATVMALTPYLDGAEVFEKIHFSALREAGVPERLRVTGRTQIVLCGTETHVCVMQTGLDLLTAGYQVFVIADACGSRTEANKTLGLSRLQQEGARIVSTEMVLFEWLERAGTDAFKAMLPLIK